MDNGSRFPSRASIVMSNGGTRGARCRGRSRPSNPVGWPHRQIRAAISREGSVRPGGNPTPKALRPYRREKPLARWGATVPQTDTGGQVEETQVDERTSVKELGKLAP